MDDDHASALAAARSALAAAATAGVKVGQSVGRLATRAGLGGVPPGVARGLAAHREAIVYLIRHGLEPDGIVPTRPAPDPLDAPPFEPLPSRDLPNPADAIARGLAERS